MDLYQNPNDIQLDLYQNPNDIQLDLYQNPNDIQTLCCGVVVVLKAELWEGNKSAGLVHRSPTPLNGESRLLLRLDFGN